MSLKELKEAIEQLPPKDRVKLMDWLSLELSESEAHKLNTWADEERAAGRTQVFESPAAYLAARRAARRKTKVG